MYLKSLSVVCTGEELVVPCNQFNENLVGGGGVWSGATATIYAIWEVKGVFFPCKPCKGTILECVLSKVCI
jgi:hypothetical protein